LTVQNTRGGRHALPAERRAPMASDGPMRSDNRDGGATRPALHGQSRPSALNLTVSISYVAVYVTSILEHDTVQSTEYSVTPFFCKQHYPNTFSPQMKIQSDRYVSCPSWERRPPPARLVPSLSPTCIQCRGSAAYGRPRYGVGLPTLHTAEPVQARARNRWARG
jgi:hypothetical protein